MNENYLLSEEKINEIRSSVDIVEVIGEYIPLTGKGKNFFCVCPFHDDHSPSMSISKDRQIYKCFSCGAGGNVFTFVKNYENISFIEAVKKMAVKAGIFLDINTKEIKKNDKYQKYYDMYDIALKFYTNNINTKEGVEAKKYLEKRGIDNDIIKHFKIGLSLKNTTLLTGMLEKKGYTKKELLDYGLATSKNNDIYDIYYNRIMFPLFNLEGKIVGFSGRVYDQNTNFKYINTKETEIFKKGENLYNYHIAKNVARNQGTIIVVEGFMDVIRLYKIGIENVVATMGTNVTKEQLLLIKKMAKEIILMFDGDSAGKKAAFQVSTELTNSGIDPKIVILEDNLDPDEYILKNGKEKMLFHLEHPMNVMDFKLEYLKQDKDINSADGLSDYIHSMIDELNKITDPILRESTIIKLSNQTGFDIEFIKNELKEINKKQELKKVEPKKEIKKLNRYEEAEKRLLFYMLNSEEVVKEYKKKVHYLNISKYRLLAKEISYFYDDNGYVKEADLISYFRKDEELSATLEEIMSLQIKEEYKKEEIEDYIRAINENKIENSMKYLKESMRKTNDELKKRELSEQIVEMKKRLEEDRCNYERN